MTVTGISFERAYHTRMDELRREAFRAAQARQATPRPLARVAAALRKLAARLDRSGKPASGPWREDFKPVAARQA